LGKNEAMERVRDESLLLIRKCFASKKSKQAIAFFLKIKKYSFCVYIYEGQNTYK
jgi:hypothetical protein